MTKPTKPLDLYDFSNQVRGRLEDMDLWSNAVFIRIGDRHLPVTEVFIDSDGDLIIEA